MTSELAYFHYLVESWKNFWNATRICLSRFIRCRYFVL